MRRLWPEVLTAVKARRRFAWILLSQNAQVLGVDAGGLTLAFNSTGARDSFGSSGSADVLRDCLIEVLGADLKVSTVVDGAAAIGQASREAAPHQRSAGHQERELSVPEVPADPTRQAPPVQRVPEAQAGWAPAPASSQGDGPAQQGTPGRRHVPSQQRPARPSQQRHELAYGPDASPAAGGDQPGHDISRPAHPGHFGGYPDEPPREPRDDPDEFPGVDPGDVPSRDDISVDESGKSATQLLIDELDAEILSEEDLN